MCRADSPCGFYTASATKPAHQGCPTLTRERNYLETRGARKNINFNLAETNCMNEEIIEKLRYILIEISKQKANEEYLIEILSESSFNFEDASTYRAYGQNQWEYNLKIFLTPDIFIRNFDTIKNIENIIKHRLNTSTPPAILIRSVTIIADIEKLVLIKSKIFPVSTEWDEINDWQNKLIDDLQKIKHPSDLQNIGNTCRNIMHKLSKQVFDPQKHKPNKSERDVSGDKYKNQLIAYIETELKGESKKAFRSLSNSLVEFLNDSVEIMHKLDHALDANKYLAEVCVIGTISTISIINLIRNIE